MDGDLSRINTEMLQHLQDSVAQTRNYIKNEQRRLEETLKRNQDFIERKRAHIKNQQRLLMEMETMLEKLLESPIYL